MTALTLDTLHRLPAGVQRPAYDPRALAIGVVHFGPGAFHRAHQAAYLDTLASRDPRWGVCAVSLQSPGVRDALAPQDGLYTLATLAAEPGFRVIGVLRELLVAPENPAAVTVRLASTGVQVVTSTVTEKGYCLQADGRLDLAHADIAHDLAHPAAPRSLIGHLVAGLAARRAAGIAPFVLIPCDNLPHNGRRLKAAVVALAAERDAALSRWIADTLVCPNTMVDSITPASDDALRERVAAATGLADAWPVQREPFAQWVIEQHEHSGGPDWASVGVTLAADVATFERAKLWMLNGAHSALAYLGQLRGHRTVPEAMADAELAGWVRGYLLDDLAPRLQPFDAAAYAEAVLARFANPALQHQLTQIAMDGSQKLPVRILAPLQGAIAVGAPLAGYARIVAAWLRFVQRQHSRGIPLADPLAAALADLAAGWRGEAGTARDDMRRALAFTPVFPLALAVQEGWLDALTEAWLALAPASD